MSALQSHASRFSLIDELDALGAPPSALHAPHVELPPSLDAQLDQSLPPLPPRRWLEMTADFERLGALLRATSASGIDSAPLNGKASSDRASVVDSIDDELGTLVGCASCELQRRAGGEWKRVRLARRGARLVAVSLDTDKSLASLPLATVAVGDAGDDCARLGDSLLSNSTLPWRVRARGHSALPGVDDSIDVVVPGAALKSVVTAASLDVRRQTIDELIDALQPYI